MYTPSNLNKNKNFLKKKVSLNKLLNIKLFLEYINKLWKDKKNRKLNLIESLIY
jgi:hypothetical protein